MNLNEINPSLFSDQRAEHVRLRHEGQVHQANPEKGLKVREQVRKATGEGSQIRIRKPGKTISHTKNISKRIFEFENYQE